MLGKNLMPQGRMAQTVKLVDAALQRTIHTQSPYRYIEDMTNQRIVQYGRLTFPIIPLLAAVLRCLVLASNLMA